MKILIACFMFLVVRWEVLSTRAQLLLGQYPITLENIRAVNLDEVRVDLHVGISPEEYDNLTRSNNVSIRAQATDTPSLDAIEVPVNGVSSQSRKDDVYFPVTGFNENVNYTVLLQSVNNTGQPSNISDPFSLLTTSVQRITVGSINSNRATILCHFLPGTKSDGCLVQWQEQGTEGDKREILTHRNATESMVVTQLSSLQPNTTYVVEAFSMMGEEKLHSFGIPLEQNLVTPSSSSASEQSEIRSIALGIGISLVSIGIICAFICTIIRNVHKRKGNFVPMPTTNAPNISTMLGTGLNDQNRQSHSYITRRGGTNVDDIALQLNVRYSRASFNPTDTKHQGSRENESSYLYDDVIVVSQSASQQPRQNSQVLPQSVALPVRCDLHSKQHFETASESTDNDNNSLQEQSPDYVISSINSLVLENAKKTFPVDRYDSPLATPAYENVDPANGLPIAPQGERIIMVRSGWTTRGTGEPERATLPLAGVHRVQQRVSKPRAQSAAPVIEPADYEEPVATLTRGQKLKKMTK